MTALNQDAVNYKELSAPLLYLSSADWEGLEARAFHEPMQMEGGSVAAHHDVNLILFTGGAMHLEQRRANGSWEAHCLRQSDLMLSTGQPYEIRWKSLTESPTQTLHLRLNKRMLTQTAQAITGSDRACLSLHGQTRFQDSLLSQIGYALWRELEQGAPAGKIYAETAAQLLAAHLLRHYSATDSSAVGELKEPTQCLTHRQMNLLTDFVIEHLNRELSLAELADLVGFSAYHFARLFRQTTGESPHQFVLRLRVERAQALLTKTDLPLAHIALESGFANQSHFSRLFKRHLGVTPRTYRQEY